MSTFLKASLLVLSLLFILATLLPLLRQDEWWIRIFDFPRAQIAAGGGIILMLYLFAWDTQSLVENIILTVLVLCVAYQGYRMVPYTPLAGKQVIRAEDPSPDAGISLLIANVLMTNRTSSRLIELVRENEPDLVLTVETDDWWEEQLRVLETEGYTYTVKEPLDNTYGMLLYARLELVEPEVKYLMKDDIPSIHTRVRLPSGDLVWLHGLHPEPPYPKEAKETTERDAELLIVGRSVESEQLPTIVAGDLNDVAWSHTTTLFQNVSGLLDPRIGRGMYNTFSAQNPVLRWPLDHVFHSEHFKLVRLERLDAFGSDHFPVFIALSLQQEAPLQQEEPEADGDEEKEAEEKIEKAQEKKH